MNRFAICLVLSIVLGSASQLLLKASAPELTLMMAQYTQWDKPGGLLAIFKKMLFTKRAELFFLSGGLLLYATAMFTWIATLRGYELAKAYPCLSLSYVLVYLGAVLTPGIQEALTFGTTLGILMIVFGIYLVFREPTPELQS